MFGGVWVVVFVEVGIDSDFSLSVCFLGRLRRWLEELFVVIRVI